MIECPTLTGCLPQPASAVRAAWPKALIVMAHPDDEYTLAATAYRISRELGGVVDHVVITNGEGGYRYAFLAEAIYGVSIAREVDGRTNLPAIRRQETLNAGRVLGIRRHYFLEQIDSGFEGNCAGAQWRAWDCALIRDRLAGLLAGARNRGERTGGAKAGGAGGRSGPPGGCAVRIWRPSGGPAYPHRRQRAGGGL